MDTYEAIVTRRSTRKFKDTLPSEEALEKIIEAGRYAPSGGNSQTSHFYVITNKDLLKEIAEVVQKEFAVMDYGENAYRSLVTSINRSRSGEYVFHFNVPCLIVAANKRGYGNAMADTALALENMMIEANELGLGTCYVNQVRWLASCPDSILNNGGKPNGAGKLMADFLRDKLGIPDTEIVCASLCIGYPDTEDGLPNRKPLDRTGNVVTYLK